MGLDVTHNAFSSAYSAFNRFRAAVCRATGGHWCDNVSGHDQWFMGPDFCQATHPGLYEFLAHSDCDGEISSELAAACANEMEPLIPALDAESERIGHAARKWIAGCKEAAKLGEPLEFY